MKKVLHMIAVLSCVGLISGLGLVFMYRYANPLIAENRRDEMRQAIFKVFPGGKSYEEETVEGEPLFKVKDGRGKFLGYAFTAEGNGYQGAIKIMAGIDPGLKALLGIEILESQETPGLGQEIATDKFKKQFKNLKVTPPITYIKNAPPEKPNEIQAITGATVSSSAVCGILNERINQIKEKLQ